jgi:hypothetical protein
MATAGKRTFAFSGCLGKRILVSLEHPAPDKANYPKTSKAAKKPFCRGFVAFRRQQKVDRLPAESISR